MLSRLSSAILVALLAFIVTASASPIVERTVPDDSSNSGNPLDQKVKKIIVIFFATFFGCIIAITLWIVYKVYRQRRTELARKKEAIRLEAMGLRTRLHNNHVGAHIQPPAPAFSRDKPSGKYDSRTGWSATQPIKVDLIQPAPKGRGRRGRHLA